MHLTLHVTNQCNLDCKYCFVGRGPERMSFDVAKAAVDFGVRHGKSTGILFYGGEPLLERELIYKVIEYAQEIKVKTSHNFYYKMTTNGVLLDEDFLKFAREINLTIGFSHDGLAQDDCRCFPDGGGSFDILQNKIPLLLKYQPYATAMSVMDTRTIHRAAETVKFLFDSGFRYITQGINYDRKAPWTSAQLEIMRREYAKMAEMYIAWSKAEEKFYLSPFEMKILSHIKGEKYNADRRNMNQEQPSIAPDGKLYYGSRYVSDPNFEIGDVFSGFDRAKQENLIEYGGQISKPCRECAIKTRCNYVYDSLNMVDGKIVCDIAPLQCAHEQIITPIADKVAETLYEERNALFIHKHYNELYPMVSLVEDRGGHL